MLLSEWIKELTEMKERDGDRHLWVAKGSYPNVSYLMAGLSIKAVPDPDYPGTKVKIPVID